MRAAERLYAEYGLIAVSNRQISEAAGQGNNTAVGYHFGTKAELVRAIIRSHSEAMEKYQERMLAGIGDSEDIRDWVACLVRPATDHLASLGVPSWYARFAVQVLTDPVLRAIVIDEALVRRPLQRVHDGLERCLGPLPAQVRAERGEMARHLITHTCAERERALAEGTRPGQSSWEHVAIALTDAITGLFLAPFTPRPEYLEDQR
ncbi:TetR family transcriptional regulator [Kitasatospora viridis]|uniref:TetR family transcriptional regulator n=2 Tax=Kitasatospora viridis TaxID=281105 RepID=A0A561TWE9_9ACTN|nr:TetR family transcriptional regulator [Kitasatospora viridis]